MARLIDYVVLPAEITPFEESYLRRMNRVGLAFFAIHIPFMIALAWFNGTRPWLAALLTTAVVAGPALAYATLSNPRAVSVLYGMAAMFMGGVLVHFGQGPLQIEMHFYFFALLAMLAVFGNPMVIIAAAVTVALHHLAMWFLLPTSVFNYDAPVWVVAVHAAFVVLESVAACFISRSFFDNVIGLSRIVQARTAELDAKNRDMRLVLDNVAQGFVTIDRDGAPAPDCSLPFERWFGAPRDSGSLFDLFGKKSETFAEMSAVSWSEVAEGVMPLALTLEQMPRDLVVDGSNLHVTYVPIGESEAPERFLVVVTDVTAEVRRERAECQRREEMQLYERLLSNRGAVNGFFDEGAALVKAITGPEAADDLVSLNRMLHTLKGNSAIFGMESVATLCHELESRVSETAAVPPAGELTKLRERWDALAADVERLAGARHKVIEIDDAGLAELELAVRRGAEGKTILNMIHTLALEPTGSRLDHFAEQARRIAARLDKSVEVHVDSGGLRVDPSLWSGFWGAFIHAVRNAVDHGLETGSERVSAGKPSRGQVTLKTFLRNERLHVEVTDDGRGMDWKALAQKAKTLGIAAETPEEVRSALFHQGVSTAMQITELSGRGIGMGAVYAETRSLGGGLEIESLLGQGTTLRMTFPVASMSRRPKTARPIQTSAVTTGA